jgi:beta-lactamase class A
MVKKVIILLVILLIVSISGNIISVIFLQNSNADKTTFDDLQEKYPYLSKRTLQEFPQDVLLNFLDLRMQLKSITSPMGDNFGLYFEYLPTGVTIGINEKVQFHAASLFKLPIVMAYYHTKERLKTNNDPMLTLQQDQLDNQFGDLWKKGAGTKIKASDAVKLALTQSDNTAAKVLVPLIDKQDFDAVYGGLDIDLQSDNQGALVSTKNYSSILKALYFSSVLSKDDSQEILDLLTKTAFPDKLASGVPDTIPVAHKIGDFVDNQGNEGFRDCGIVYVPRRPYILCMFSVGDEQIARERMQTVSQAVYYYVSSTN